MRIMQRIQSFSLKPFHKRLAIIIREFNGFPTFSLKPFLKRLVMKRIQPLDKHMKRLSSPFSIPVSRFIGNSGEKYG